MPVINKGPLNLKDTDLYQILLKKDGDSSGLLSKLDDFVTLVSPMLDLVIAGPFKNYTLHNKNHSIKLVHLAGKIIPTETLNSISLLEGAIVIYSAFLHDLGMAVTSIEREKILSEPEFNDFLRSSNTIWHKLSSARDKHKIATGDDKSKIELEIYQLHEAAISNYLRIKHASKDRYRDLIARLKKTSGRNDLFDYCGVSFEDVLIDICESHNLDTGVLAEVAGTYNPRFSRELLISDQKLNVQYCAAILRLIDIFDFDSERTPKILFESLGIEENSLPGANVTFQEWQKHMAVYAIEVKDHEILFHAESDHPAIEASIVEFCRYIERELRDTLSIVRNNNYEISQKYSINLPSIVRANVRSRGYVFHDIRFRLNQSTITTLLMGERLYSGPGAALRELLQNSIDACDVRIIMQPTGYKPNISVTLVDENNQKWIEVFDNGIGMDENIISEYLFQIGNSYYDSPEFQRIMQKEGKISFNPISKFGIGIASVFMICDLLEVTTSNHFSVRGDKKERRVLVDGQGGLAYITEKDNGFHGTKIRIKLKETFTHHYNLAKLESYIRDVVVRPKYNVDVSLIRKFNVGPECYFRLRDNAVEKLTALGIHPVTIMLDRFSDSLEGIIVLPLVTRKDGKLGLGERKYLFDENKGLKPQEYFDMYSGNRLTVNGFRMGLKNVNRVFGRRLRFAFDINVKGDNNIIFDVSRDKIIGYGVTEVRRRLREAILLGLKETGIYDRLDKEAESYIKSNRLLIGDDSTSISDEFLRQVKSLLPNETWPIGIHISIAEKLNVGSSRVRSAISLLLETGDVYDGRMAKR